jgi:nucleotide-binding universal stress UspA family protein
MKKILIPTDFSQVTEKALIVATEISRKTHAEVELLHIIESPSHMEFNFTGEPVQHNGLTDVFVLKSINLAKKKMKAIMDNIQYVGVRFRPMIKVASPYTHFTRHIVKEPVDLIIMGTAGTQSFLKGFFSSSNAEKIVTNADCMVLSVKNGIENFRLRNLVFATDFEDDSSDFLIKINELQDIFDFKIHLLYVNALVSHTSDIDRIKNQAHVFVKKHNIKNYEFQIVEDITEYTGIVDFATTVNADIIALSTHQHKGLHWLGGISEDLVNYADQPVLTYKVD